jgi:hypothetical protein
MRVVLIALDEPDAERWCRQQPHLELVDVVWVSPRSPQRAHGQTADAVLVTDTARLQLTNGQYTRLLEGTLPTIASGGTGAGGGA